MQKEPMKRTQIRMTQSQYKKMKDLQYRTGMSLSEHTRRAIDCYFEHLNAKKEITGSSW